MADVYPPMMAAAREWLKTRCGVDDFFRELTLMAFLEPNEVNLTRFVAYLLQREMLRVGAEPQGRGSDLLRDRGGDSPSSSSSSSSL